MTDSTELQKQAADLLDLHAVPSGAIAAVREIINSAFLLGQELHGGDFTDGAGPDETCGCGEGITWYDGEWMHIANPELRGTDDHDAEPEGGYYEPGDEDEDEEDSEPMIRCTCTLLFPGEQAMHEHAAKNPGHAPAQVLPLT